MRNLLLAAAALAALTTAGSAADGPSRLAPVVAPAFTWTGFYAGVNAGAAWSDGTLGLSSTTPGFFVDALNIADFGDAPDEARFTGGAQIGVNYQIGASVVGAEVDISFVNLKNRDVASYTEVAPTFTFSETLAAEQKVEWFGTLRARLGFTPIERLLAYATGGLAFGQVKSSSTDIGFFTGFDPSFSFSGRDSDTRWGWTLGAGAEYAVTDRLTVKGEYLYVDLRTGNYAVTDPAHPELGTYNVRDEANVHVLRAGLNYKFGTY